MWGQTMNKCGLIKGLVKKGAGNRSQAELPRKAGKMTGICTCRSNHQSHLIMKIDISCLELLLMSLESGVSLTFLAAVLSEAAQHLTGQVTSLKPLQCQKVTQSQKILSFSFHTRAPIFYLIGVHFILKVPNVSKIQMCNNRPKRKTLCTALLLKY